MAIASFSAMVLIDPEGEQDHGVIFLSGMLGLAFYALVLFATGHFNRFLPTISAVGKPARPALTIEVASSASMAAARCARQHRAR